MASQIEVAQVVNMIGAAYPNFAPTTETVMVYYELLKDLPVDLLKTATLQCCAESGRKFAPSIGEIRGAVADIKRSLQKIPSALEAWGELLKVPKAEEYKDIVEDGGQTFIQITPYTWSHPLVRKVAVMMGFPRFPDWESESFERTAFFKAYEIELQRYLREQEQLPDVVRYIENKASQSIKQLANGMAK